MTIRGGVYAKLDRAIQLLEMARETDQMEMIRQHIKGALVMLEQVGASILESDREESRVQ